MTNPMFNPQPNYSGVTIQIANPAVNVGDCSANCGYGNNIPQVQSGYIQSGNINGVSNSAINRYTNSPIPQNNYITYPQGSYSIAPDNVQGIQDGNQIEREIPSGSEQYNMTNSAQNIPNAYPAQYYLNNYNYGPNTSDANRTGINGIDTQRQNDNYTTVANRNITDTQTIGNNAHDVSSYRVYADKPDVYDNDLTRSKNIIGELDERVAEEQKDALTDEYIKSLENYLNNPNDEIRLMASKEVLKRLDEDKDRYNDAALNALLNKMMQDPSKLVRIAALSAFSSQLASGNDYTVKLLRDIQSNPNADKEDVLQAADIMLKMSAGVEMKKVPIPEKKDNK